MVVMFTSRTSGVFVLVVVVTLLSSEVLTAVTASHIGIQVSSEDGDIDWRAVRRGNKPNIAFALIRGSEGSYMDPLFQRNFEQARQADIFQTKYVHVFRTQEKDDSSSNSNNSNKDYKTSVPSNTQVREITVTSQIQRIKKMMFLVNFDKLGHENRSRDELVIRVTGVSGDSGLTGGWPNSRLFGRIKDLVHEINDMGIKPIIQTEKAFWDNFVWSGESLEDSADMETICMSDFSAREQIQSIPLSVCQCAIESFAPLSKGSINNLPLGLLAYEPVDNEDLAEQDKAGYYYWHYSDRQRVIGIGNPVAFVMRVYPFQRPRLSCRWTTERQRIRPRRPHHRNPIVPAIFSGDHWRRGIPSDNYSRRCRRHFDNTVAAAAMLPALLAAAAAG